MTMEKIAVIIVAGGSGKRMASPVKKQFIKLRDKAILAYTIEAFQCMEEIQDIIVVTSKEDISKVKTEIVEKYDFHKVRCIVEGGKERQDSVYNGLLAVDESMQYVMIHDGARPFISQSILKEAIEKTIRYKATVVAVPTKDTIKRVDVEQNTVKETLPREQLWLAQTPQSFKKELLLKAYHYAIEQKLAVTDDSSIVEAYGHKVAIVLGDYKNIKITTPEDLILGESFLGAMKEE